MKRRRSLTIVYCRAGEEEEEEGGEKKKPGAPGV